MTSLWAVMALAIDAPSPRLHLLLALLYAVAAVLLMRSGLWVAWAACFALVLLWWLTLKAPGDGPWEADVSRTAYGEVQGDQVTLHNVRNCAYRAEFDYTCQWMNRTVPLDQITGVDLFMDYWGSPLIAHTILSFPGRDGSHVAFSIEARRRPGQTYSAWRGFFRQFTLVSVVSEESDVVRLRTNYRKDEELYLFHTGATPSFAQSLFLDYLAMTNRLHGQAAWYNALSHNCTTEIYTLESMRGQHWDWRILLNGKGDEMLYQQGLLVSDGLPYPALKQRAWINPAAQRANTDPDFSARIREGRPGFTPPR